MNEMIEKLLAILAEMGVEKEKLDAAVEALSEGEGQEVPPEANGEEPSNPEETPVPEELPPAEEPPVEEEQGEVPPEEIPPVPQEEASVPPAEEQVPPAPEGEVPPVEEPPVAEQPPMPPLPPMVSLEEFNQLKSDFEELKKANEGLKANYNAMFEALKAAGVVDGSQVSPVGHDEPSTPSRNSSDVTMDNVLAEINRKPY